MVLTQYNEYVRDRTQGAFQGSGTDVETNIACPNCGESAIHANLQEIIDNKPPQHPAWCVACSWNGTV